MKYSFINLLTTSILLIMLSNVSCNEKKNVIDLIKSSDKANQKELKPASITNLDSLCGFRKLKLNSPISEYDLSKFDVISTKDGEYKRFYLWLQTGDIYYASNNIKGIELFFYKEKLVGIKLKFKEAKSLLSDLKTAFGDPSVSAKPIDFKNILKRYRVDWENYYRFPNTNKLSFEDDSHPLKLSYQQKVDEIEYGNPPVNKWIGLPKSVFLSEEEKQKILLDQALHYLDPLSLHEEAKYYWNSNLVELQYYSKFTINMPSLTHLGYDKNFYDECDYVLNYVDSFSNLFKSRNLYEFGIKEDETYTTLFYKPILNEKDWEAGYQSSKNKEIKENQRRSDSISKQNALDDL